MAGRTEPPVRGGGLLDSLPEAERRFEELEGLMADPSVEPTRRGAIVREYGAKRPVVELYRELKAHRKEQEDAEKLAADPATDAEMRALATETAREETAAVERLTEKLLEKLATEDESFARDVIVEVRAGEGGDEAALWARDLFQVYRNFAGKRGWTIEVYDSSTTELGGIREVVFQVSGDRVYDSFRFEGGGHRVQRVPSTETQGRIHSSACTVAVLPQAEEVDVVLRPEDLIIEAVRAGGPGGQHVNKTASAVQITHKPTGLFVHCQEQRSQHQNKDRALRIIRSKLLELETERKAAERNLARKTQAGSGGRHERIRTYNFPQSRVTDHRLAGEGDGEESGPGKNFGLERVLEGDLAPIHDALRDMEKRKRLREVTGGLVGGKKK